VSARVGILGAGQAGSRQAHGFAAQPDARVVGVADVDLHRAGALAQRYGAAAVGDHEALLDLGLDVLVVATPHALHVAPTLAAARRGVHVMLEKPIATSLADAAIILDACGAADVRLATSFVHRFREESRRAAAWLTADGPGRLARETVNGQVTAAHPGWLADPALAGGGVLMYTAIHGIDRLRWLLRDDIAEVVAGSVAFEPGARVESGVAALLRFAGGAVATLSTTAPRYRPEPTLWETEVFTDRTMVRLRTRGFAQRSSDHGTDHYDCASDPETHDPHYNFARQARDLLDAVAHSRPPSVDGMAGLHALEVCLAIYRSAAEQRPVEIAEIATEGAAAGVTRGAVR